MSQLPEIIYAYTDEDAVADGLLVNIGHLNLHWSSRGIEQLIPSRTPTPINRMTRLLWHKVFELTQPKELDVGTGEYVLDNKVFQKAVAEIMLPSMVKEGGVWQGSYQGVKVWLMENELGGWTLMLPEDY